MYLPLNISNFRDAHKGQIIIWTLYVDLIGISKNFILQNLSIHSVQYMLFLQFTL